MRFIDIARRAGRSLRQAKARTLLTSLAIGVGAFTIVLSLALGAGGRQYASDIISANTDEREIYIQAEQEMGAGVDPSAPREYTDEPSMNYGGGVNLKMLSDKDIEKLSEVKGVESVSPYYNLTIKYVTTEGSKKYTLGAETYNDMIALEYIAGSSKDIKPGSVVIPDSLREVLGFDSAKAAIGEPITIVIEQINRETFTTEEVEFEYTIAAVNKQSSLAVADGSGSVKVHEDDAEKLHEAINEGSPNESAYMAAVVTVADKSEAESVKERINSLGGYEAQTAEDAMSFLFQFINVLQTILIGFGALAVLTSVFGIINTQYISVLERTSQIGLMKALGTRRRDVGRLFKLEAAWIGFLGGALGAGLAVIAGTLANPAISDMLSLGEARLIIFEIPSIVAVIIGLTLVSVVAGILPASKASKLDPIEALRTE